MTMIKTIEAKLKTIVSAAHQLSRDDHACRSNCGLTAYALSDVLQRLGANAYPLIVEVEVFAQSTKPTGPALGAMTDKPTQPNAHIVVAIGDELLLDPTQAHMDEATWVDPIVLRLNDDFWSGGKVRIEGNETVVEYRLYQGQRGVYLRQEPHPSYWKLLADETMDTLAGIHFSFDREGGNHASRQDGLTAAPSAWGWDGASTLH
jgi:hypothetical protein